jgi:hypothetical protein
MNFSKFIFLLFPILISCQTKDDYLPEIYFSKEIQKVIINQSVKYSMKGATHKNKFNSEFNWYYDIATAECDFRRCYPINKNGEYFFLMTRKARSIWPAREAIGGTIKIDGKNKLLDYNEIFRTWKMAEDSLNLRAFELFDLMVKEKDLTPYRSKNKGDRYIEFPDDRYHFDQNLKIWKDSTINGT